MRTQILIGRLFVLACSLGSLLAGSVPDARAQDHWVATWAASPQSPRLVFARFPTPPPPSGAQPSQANPPPPPAFPAPPTINNQTVRMIVRSSIGGRRVRVELSNAFGSSALLVGAAHVALHDKESAIVGGSDRPLTFSGKPSFTIPPAAKVISDPVELEVPRLGDLVISLYIPGQADTPTVHLTALHTTYLSQPGDWTGAISLADSKTVQLWYWISTVDVDAPLKAGLIVALGDSITDGATSTADMNRSWPSQMAERLARNNRTTGIAIVNQGISGNRLLNDGAGVSALARLDRDVLSLPGVRWLIVLEGINDIGLGGRPGAQPPDAVTAEDLIAAYQQIIARAHMHGIRVIGGTLTPYLGAAYATDEGESIREAVNQWIRTSHAYDAVIDFDAAIEDPANPKHIRPTYNTRDHLHPNDEGYKAMAAAVDLSLFAAEAKP